jgi:hypothetical protein
VTATLVLLKCSFNAVLWLVPYFHQLFLSLTAASAPWQVLELVLQNPQTAFAAGEICSLLCSIKAIRKAAQQAGGPCSNILLTGSTRYWNVVSRVASFAKWLPAHANLLGTLAEELDLDSTDEFDDGDREQIAQHNVLDTILALSVQGIAASTTSSCTGTAAAMAHQQQQQHQGQRPPFALRSFSSSIRHSSDVLAALPAATLTQLAWDADVPQGDESQQTAMAGAVAHLTNLQRLDVGDSLGGVWLPVIAQLKQLTYLEINELHAFVDEEQHLPENLVELSLPNFYVYCKSECDEASEGGVEADGGQADVAGVEGDDGAGAMAAADQRAAESGDARQLDFSHLTRLTRLLLGLVIRSIQQEQQPVRVDALLPLQLLQLDVSCYRCAVLPMLNITALTQLRSLILAECEENDDSLLSLNRLS